MEKTIFDKIIEGSIPSWIVWSDDNFIAFLTPFALVEGQTIVVPKKNPGNYIFGMKNQEYLELMMAAKKVAGLLEKAFNVNRVGVVVEGLEVPHVHVKLYPIRDEKPLGLNSEGPKMDDSKLDEIKEKILSVKI